MTNLNERTNTLLYKKIYLSHFIRKCLCFFCVRGELETGTDCYILTQSFSDHSSTSSSFWLGCSTVGHWGPKPSIWSCFSLRHLVPDWLPRTPRLQLTQAVCGTWLYNYLTSTCFLWAYACARNSTTSTSQGDIPISSTGCTCFLCSSAYLHWCISWLTARSRVNMLHNYHKDSFQKKRYASSIKLSKCT